VHASIRRLLLLLLLLLLTVLLLDVLQLLMLSAGTSMSLEIIMFPLNTFYCEQDTVCMLSTYLIVCVQKSILIFSFRSIILCPVILLVGIGLFISSYKHFIFIIIIIIILFVCLCCICNWPFGCWYSTLK
jgi:hypothetical protein